MLTKIRFLCQTLFSQNNSHHLSLPVSSHLELPLAAALPKLASPGLLSPPKFRKDKDSVGSCVWGPVMRSPESPHVHNVVQALGFPSTSSQPLNTFREHLVISQGTSVGRTCSEILEQRIKARPLKVGLWWLTYLESSSLSSLITWLTFPSFRVCILCQYSKDTEFYLLPLMLVASSAL